MKQATRENLAKVAKEKALLPFHGAADGKASNLAPIAALFPTWSEDAADGLWCAAFVLYCFREAGFAIPYRPKACKTCHLAGCLGWEEFAKFDPRIEYHKGDGDFVPQAGDIVLYDRVFENAEHDHIGIVLEKREHTILAAEGNLNNISGVIERPIDEHIRAYIRIPDGYSQEETMHLRLIKLTKQYEQKLGEMIDEWRADQEANHTNRSPWSIFKNDYHDFDFYLANLEHKVETADRVPDSVFFLLDEDRDRLIGAVNIRHYLNDGLLREGGHIGDGIRPSERRKGYGTELVRLALIECKKLGIKRVLMTCDRDNIGSAKTIRNNGGVLENEIVNSDGVIEQRYWIDLSDRKGGEQA